VQISHNVLVRAIRHAERHDLVGRNVGTLIKPPKGQRDGRPSKSLTLDQAIALMDASKGTRLEAYVIVSLLTGLRTEEVRALRWDHVVAWVGGQWCPVAEAGFDHNQVAVFAWRAERAGGDTKTPKSRRTLALPRRCVLALREQRIAETAEPNAVGPLDDSLLDEDRRQLLKTGGPGGWLPVGTDAGEVDVRKAFALHVSHHLPDRAAPA
jgi:integrase